MGKRVLNDRIIKAIKPPKVGQRAETWDAIVPGLGIRVTDTGAKSFVLVARYPGAKHPARRTLGSYGALSLEQAREKARAWLQLIQRGIDPALEVERQRLAEARKRAGTFASIANDFVHEKLAKERQGIDAGRALRRFVSAWGDRLAADIAALDVLAVIKPVKAHSPYMAHSMLTVLKRFYNWAIDQHVYGLETSPCDRLRPAAIIGEKKPRQRVLNEDEIFALHRAASRMHYPAGPTLLTLLLTGQRHSDVALAPWAEINLERREWIIAAGRFKSNVSHLVPLTEPVMTLLAELPRFKGMSKLFGRSITGAVKQRLDARMLRTLKALARKRGQDWRAGKLEPFVVHDIRRTMRTRLTQLKVPSEVAERVIGHGPRGLERVYNLH